VNSTGPEESIFIAREIARKNGSKSIDKITAAIDSNKPLMKIFQGFTRFRAIERDKTSPKFSISTPIVYRFPKPGTTRIVSADFSHCAITFDSFLFGISGRAIMTSLTPKFLLKFSQSEISPMIFEPPKLFPIFSLSSVKNPATS